MFYKLLNIVDKKISFLTVSASNDEQSYSLNLINLAQVKIVEV